MEPELESLIGGVINKEVELALAKQKHVCNKKWDAGNEMHPSESRSLQLQFLNKLSLPVLTGTKIGGEEYTSIKVALVDGLTGQVVNSGPEASAKVEIVAIEKDFNGYEGDNWTLEEFNSNIISKRDGKRPLLTGDVYFHLKEGIGSIGGVYFAHTKRWMTKCEFRLGARIVDGSQGVRVREAKTEPFIVEDRRGKLYQKRHPPSLSDAVWRLEKIGKDGAFHKRLSKENIDTVKDFVTLLNINPQRLKDILGTTMPAKMWKVIMDHAQTCTLDQRLYFYCSPGSLQKTGVVFNVVGEVRGLISECQYAGIDKLSETAKVDTLKLVIAAFNHLEDVVPIDDEASLFNGSLCLPNVLPPSNSVITESSDGSNIRSNDHPQASACSDGCKVLTSQKISGFGYPQASACSPDIMPSIFSLAGVASLDDFGLHNIDNMDLRYDQSLYFPGQVANSLICETESITPAFCEDEHLQYFDADCSLQSQNSSLESQVDLHSSMDLRYDQPLYFPGQVANSLICETESITPTFCEDEHLQYFDADCSLQSQNSSLESQADLHSTMGLRYDQPLYFSSQVANSLICETEFITPAFCKDEHMQYFDADCSLQSQNLSLESQADLHHAVSGFLLARSAAFAQRRWTMLFSVLKWFSIRMIVAKKTHFRDKQRC